jgi:hypothetical protein
MNRQQARELVEKALNAKFNNPEVGPLVVLDEWTKEKPYGWIFCVNSQRFAETRDRQFSVIGNSPVVFLRHDESIHLLPSGISTDEAIKEFENRTLPRIT